MNIIVLNDACITSYSFFERRPLPCSTRLCPTDTDVKNRASLSFFKRNEAHSTYFMDRDAHVRR